MSGYYPLRALQSLLAPASARAGKVVRVASSGVQVATAGGLIPAQAGGALRVGQAVVVRDGIAYPSAQASLRYAL